jgi:uncharacterized protein (UPF0216 family)
MNKIIIIDPNIQIAKELPVRAEQLKEMVDSGETIDFDAMLKDAKDYLPKRVELNELASLAKKLKL